jgi:CRISPR-associated endonuclease Csn1
MWALALAKPERPDEKRFGKIANPTVHIGLNQVRLVVNALIKTLRAPDRSDRGSGARPQAKPGAAREDKERQAKNQKRNERLRKEAAAMLRWLKNACASADHSEADPLGGT